MVTADLLIQNAEGDEEFIHDVNVELEKKGYRFEEYNHTVHGPSHCLRKIVKPEPKVYWIEVQYPGKNGNISERDIT